MTASVVCFGDNCVDRYDAPEKRQFAGGNAVNTAVHCRAAGCKTSYVGSVGRDAGGQAVLQKLREREIDVSQVQQFDAETAWTKVVLLDKERQFLEEYLGPKDSFRFTPQLFTYLSNHTVIHNTWQGGTEHQLARFQQAGGALVSMDFGERYSQEFLDLCIPHVNIAFFSMAPSQLEQAREFAPQMHQRGPDYVVVTVGKSGSVVSHRTQGVFFEPPYPVEVVDTLGAGDTYIGTFLAAFVQQQTIPACMKLATQAAAKNCSIFGGFAGSEILPQPAP